MTRKEKPRKLVPMTCRCCWLRRAIIRIIQIAFAIANASRVSLRRSSSFSFNSSTAPNTADSGTRQACRRPVCKINKVEKAAMSVTCRRNLHLITSFFFHFEKSNFLFIYLLLNDANLTLHSILYLQVTHCHLHYISFQSLHSNPCTHNRQSPYGFVPLSF